MGDRIIDLDAFSRETVKVRCQGKEYEIKRFTWETEAKLLKLDEDLTNAKSTVEKLAVMKKMIAILIPSMPPKVVGGLNSTEASALSLAVQKVRTRQIGEFLKKVDGDLGPAEVIPKAG